MNQIFIKTKVLAEILGVDEVSLGNYGIFVRVKE